MQRLLYNLPMRWELSNSIYLGVQPAGFCFCRCPIISQRVEKLVLHGMPVYTEEDAGLANFAPPYEIDDDAGHLRWIWDRIHSEYPWIDGHLATQFCRDFLNAGPDFATSYRSIWNYDLPKGFAARKSTTLPNLNTCGGADRIAYMHER